MSAAISSADAVPVPVVSSPLPVAASRAAALARQWAIPVISITLASSFMAISLGQWDRWVSGAAVQVTDDAIVRSEMTGLSARVSGNVIEVAVQDYQTVRAGDLLMAIDPSDYRVAVSQAEAAVAGARAASSNLDNQIALQRAVARQAEAQVFSARAKVVQAGQEERRQQALLRSTFATAQKVEQAIADLANARAGLEAAEAAAQAQREQLRVLEGTRGQREADLASAEAALAGAKLRLGYTRIVAPFDGVVGQRQVQQGDYVNTGGSLISIVPLPRVHVVANYKETQLTNVEPGQSVEITVDTFPGATFKGTVERLSPASGSQFALLPPDNATGNFTKVVQRIPVRIALEPGQHLAERLRPGMSVVTKIQTRREGL